MIEATNYLVHRDGAFLATFDTHADALAYAKANEAVVSSVIHNPPVSRMRRVSFTCGKLHDSATEIAVEVSYGDASRRSHGQMYAGNPGIWVVYVEALTAEEAKTTAKKIVINALQRI